MYPPRRTEVDQPTRRTVRIKLDGEVFDMDWDQPTPPTKQDAINWIQKKRNYNPPPPPGPPVTQSIAQPPRSLWDSIKSFGSGLYDPVRGMVNEVEQTGRESSKALLSGDPIGAINRVIRPVSDPINKMPEMLYQLYQNLSGQRTAPPMPVDEAVNEGAAQLGVPLQEIRTAIKEGDYPRAAGGVLGTAGLLYGGAKFGRAVENVRSPINWEGITEGIASDFNPRARPAAQPPVEPIVGPIPQRTQPDLPFDPYHPRLPFEPPPPPPTGPMHGPDLPPVQHPTLPFEPMQQEVPYNPTARPAQPNPPVGEMPQQRSLWEDVVPEAPANPILDNAKKSTSPVIQQAAAKVGRLSQMKAKIQESSLGQVLADFGKSGMSVIKSAGKAGPELARILTKARLDGDFLGGKWIVAAKEATKGLSKAQIDDYIRSRDTGQISNDPMVQEALSKRAAIDAEVVDSIKKTGAGFKTADGKKIIPFRERINYWPHIYEKGFFKNKEGAIQALMKDGMSYEEATRAMRNASRFGERLISAQHERQSNAPGYRLDLDADYLHLNDMAKRVAEAREFGPLDIAEPTSPISKLISETNNPARIGELVSRHLGRDAPPNPAWAKTAKGLTQLETAMHLSQFVISNMSQLATVPLRSNIKEYAGALAKTLGKFKSAETEAEGTGALQTIHQDIMREVGGEGNISKFFGMKKSETFNRTVAAIAGKNTAVSLFETLKKNPNDKRARARLENLVLEPVDAVLKQPSLTPEQAGRAGGRMAEITQGRAQAIDLPKLWTGHPAVELLFLYKKYAFRQSKIIAEAIAENPTRNIPLALALYSMMGEGIGDVKAGIKGSVSGQGVGPAIATRGQDPQQLINDLGGPNSPLMGRVVSDLGQAWALGIMSDSINAAMQGKQGVFSFAAGPAYGDIAETIGNVFTGNTTGLTKQGARAIPVVGPGVAQRVGGKKGKSGGLPKLPSPTTKLPSLPRP